MELSKKNTVRLNIEQLEDRRLAEPEEQEQE